jgi:hypothetical protein
MGFWKSVSASLVEVVFDWKAPRWFEPLWIRMAPWVFGLAIGRWPHRVREDELPRDE